MKHQDVIELWQELAEYEIPDYLLEDVRTLFLQVEERTREEIGESIRGEIGEWMLADEERAREFLSQWFPNLNTDYE